MEQLKELRIQVNFRVFGDDDKKFINAFVQGAAYVEPLLNEKAKKVFYSYAHFFCLIDIKSVPDYLLEVVIAIYLYTRIDHSYDHSYYFQKIVLVRFMSTFSLCKIIKSKSFL